MPWPPLMNGNSFSCIAWKMSFTPINARIADKACLRYTRRSMSPPKRKYNWRKPMSAKMFAVNTMNGLWVSPKMAGIESKANIKRENIKEVIAEYDGAIVSKSYATYNIYSDNNPRN